MTFLAGHEIDDKLAELTNELVSHAIDNQLAVFVVIGKMYDDKLVPVFCTSIDKRSTTDLVKAIALAYMDMEKI